MKADAAKRAEKAELDLLDIVTLKDDIQAT